MIRQANMAGLKILTYLMFAMFAMTTDSVGIIIPEIVKTFRLSLTAAGTFQYATMAGIAIAGFLLGHLADRYGRKATIVVGLTLFAAASYLFIAGTSFVFFSVLMALSGIAIGIFKTGALALIGDISRSTAEHTSIMNTVEGFFAVVESWNSVAMVVRHCRNHLRRADSHGSERSLSNTSFSAYGTDGLEIRLRGYEEPVCSAVLARCVSLCRRRGRDLRLDADAAGRI
jgi:hypothetical protein